MLTIYHLPDFESCQMLFPRTLVDTVETKEEVLKILKITDQEFESAIKGNVIQKRFLIVASLDFIRKNKIKNIIEANPDGISNSEIAELYGIRRDTVYKTLMGAMDKIAKTGVNVREFLEMIKAYKRIRDNAYDE